MYAAICISSKNSKGETFLQDFFMTVWTLFDFFKKYQKQKENLTKYTETIS